jgi:hypothetical protein
MITVSYIIASSMIRIKCFIWVFILVGGPELLSDLVNVLEVPDGGPEGEGVEREQEKQPLPILLIL